MKILTEYNTRGIWKEQSLSSQDGIYYLDEIVTSESNLVVYTIDKVETSCQGDILFLTIPKARVEPFLSLSEFLAEDMSNALSVVPITIKFSVLSKSGNDTTIGIMYDNTDSEVVVISSVGDSVRTTRKVPFMVRFVNPNLYNIGDFITFNVRRLAVSSISSGVSPSDTVCVYDTASLVLITSENIKHVHIGALSNGSFIRPDTINSILKEFKLGYVIVDTSRSMVKIPDDIIIANGNKYMLVRSQNLVVSSNNIPIGFSLLRIYINNSGILTHQVINSGSYMSVLNSLNGLDILDRTVMYAIVENRHPKVVWNKIFHVGFGSGGGSGSVSKGEVQTCNRTINISYTGSVPLVQLYDMDGNMIIPETIRYNQNNIFVDVGGDMCYRVVFL